jgi:hypothetical protein
MRTFESAKWRSCCESEQLSNSLLLCTAASAVPVDEFLLDCHRASDVSRRVGDLSLVDTRPLAHGAQASEAQHKGDVAVSEGDTVRFEAQAESPRYGKLEWRGVIRSEKLGATLVPM